MQFEIFPIRNDQDLQRALELLDQVFGRDVDSPEGLYALALADLIEAYEERHYPLDLPDPIEAILIRMDDLGLSRKDLEPLIGSRGRISEVLNRKRPLTLPMIRRLSEALSLPAEVLIQPTMEKELVSVG